MSAKSSDHKKNPPFYLKTKAFKRIISDVSQRGHFIGFHPGYYTYNDKVLWTQEFKVLNDSLGTNVIEGRQHVLMYSIPETYNIWNDNGMTIDSTLGYADIVGFRCGTGDCFNIFDIIKREKLNLIERPLIIMDATLKNYMRLNAEESFNLISQYINIAKKYRMQLTILFHNSSFTKDWNGYREMYSKIFFL